MRSSPRLPPATTILRSKRSTLRFYHTDSVGLLDQLPDSTIDVVITSPPYNLGVQYRSYRDTLPEMSYLRWTSVWVAAATRVLGDDGSLFLNVGNKPTQPWTAIDVVLEARRHLILQNTIHWIKSIVIDRELAGARAGLERDLAVGHYKPINSERFLNDCHEFVFHLTPRGRTPLDRRAIGVPYQDPSNVGRWQAASEGPLPRQQLVHPLHHDSEPRARPPASGDLSAVAPPNTAYGFTVCNAPASCCTRSWGSGARPWPAPSSALISLGSKWTGPISMRRWNG